MSIRREKRRAIGLMVYVVKITARAHHIDKPHTWSENRFLSLWIGYGLGSLIIDFK